MSCVGFIFAALAALVVMPAAAQTALSAPPGLQMRFIVPFPPGGTLDVLARTIANELGPALSKTMVIENRPGASGAIGAEAVARAEPDGAALFIASNTLITLPALRKSLPFDIFKDFAPIIELGGTPTVVTLHPSFPARNYAEFVAAAKAKDQVSYNSPGIASPPHLGGELLARAAGLPLVHVSYRGTQPAVNDLVAGHIQVMMAPLNAVLPFIQDKKLYGVALTDASRTRYLLDVPTLHELGLTSMPAVTSWFAVLTTGGTPPGVVARLNQEIAKILRDPKIANVLTAQTFEIKAGTPAELAALMRRDAATNAKVVAEAGIKAE